ncbi:MAG: MBL fold metallo-hydrolase [Candidatus Hydrogenedentes bacterium]|nr:MBL fold metallo-hydrolase [Candidatus Hydrogenedentota bacterium]
MSRNPGSDSVITIDCHYYQPERAAAFLVVEDGRAAFVDNNTVFAAPLMLKALRDRGLQPEQVEYLIVTHVHLDHAGGTSALLKQCPNATVLTHPRAARHLINPSRLIESSKQVYGEEAYNRIYGVIEPADERRVRSMDDGEQVTFGGRTLTFLHTRGHANHHLVIHDTGSNAVFTGDSFGISYPAVHRGRRRYITCSCTPTEFDAAEARISAQKIVATGAERAYLTHYGVYAPLSEGAALLLQSIDQMEEILQEAVGVPKHGEDLIEHIEQRIRVATEEMITKQCGVALTESDRPWLEYDTHLNAMGLAYLAEKAKRKQ